MNPDDLARILDELGKRLGPAGAHVFDLAVRQVYIDASLKVLAGLLLVIAAVVAVRKLQRHVANEWVRWNALPEREKDYPTLNGKPDSFGGAAWWYALPGAFLVLALVLVATGLSRLLNPEYAAIRDILGAIR